MLFMYYYVYVLKNQVDDGVYIGYTTNIRKRILNHNSGRGSRTTKYKKNWELIYAELYRNKYDALGREKFLKGGSGRKYLKKQLRRYLEETGSAEAT